MKKLVSPNPPEIYQHITQEVFTDEEKDYSISEINFLDKAIFKK